MGRKLIQVNSLMHELPEQALDFGNEPAEMLLAPYNVNFIRRASWRVMMGEDIGRPISDVLTKAVSLYQLSLERLREPADQLIKLCNV